MVEGERQKYGYFATFNPERGGTADNPDGMVRLTYSGDPKKPNSYYEERFTVKMKWERSSAYRDSRHKLSWTEFEEVDEAAAERFKLVMARRVERRHRLNEISKADWDELVRDTPNDVSLRYYRRWGPPLVPQESFEDPAIIRARFVRSPEDSCYYEETFTSALKWEQCNELLFFRAGYRSADTRFEELDEEAARQAVVEFTRRRM